MWSKDPLSGNALSIPMVNTNLIPKHDPDSEYMLRLARRAVGSLLPVLTARLIIDWMTKHSVSVNAIPYRLLSYVSEEAQTYNRSSWNRPAKYLPKDIQGIPCGKLTMLINQQLLKVVQLSVRPRNQAENGSDACSNASYHPNPRVRTTSLISRRTLNTIYSTFMA